MGSASTQALAASVEALGAAKVDLATARELLSAARIVGDSSQLSGALADPTATPEARAAVVSAVFSGAGESTRKLIVAAAQQRWSNAAEFVDGLEELGIRAAVIADPKADVEGEIFAFSRTVAANPELELALGSRRGDAEAKSTLVEKLIASSASTATTAIVTALVRAPRERRIRQLLSRAIRIASEQRGRTVATVTTAVALTAEQKTRITAALAKNYGNDVALNEIVDPKLIGGIRVQIADDVIDGSVSTRLADVRQKLAS